VSDRRRDRRWRVAVAPAAFLVAAGLWTGSRVLLVAATLPLGYLAYGALSTVPAVESAVSMERELSTDAPFPGETVGVTLTVRNEGERALPDVRVVDGIPDGLTAKSGSAAAVVGLRSGESRTVTYEVVARRGRHAFGDASVRARSLSAGGVATAAVAPTGDSALSCRVAAAEAPVRERTRRFVGAIPTANGGSGVEFHSTREYRRGDSLHRIDWQRLARTGDLSTVEYRRQEAARVLVVVDARAAATASPGRGYPNSRELSAYAAELLAGVVLSAGHEAGVAAFGPAVPGTRGDGGVSVLGPGSGERFRTRVSDVCEAIAAGGTGAAQATDSDGEQAGASAGAAGEDGASEAGEGAAAAADGGAGSAASGTHAAMDAEEAGKRLLAHCTRRTQVTLVTPALDEFPVAVTETLRASGHDATVVSPDVTDAESHGGRLERIERAGRLAALRATGATVVDWDLADPLPLAVAPVLAEVGR